MVETTPTELAAFLQELGFPLVAQQKRPPPQNNQTCGSPHRFDTSLRPRRFSGCFPHLPRGALNARGLEALLHGAGQGFRLQQLQRSKAFAQATRVHQLRVEELILRTQEECGYDPSMANVTWGKTGGVFCCRPLLNMKRTKLN